MKPYTRRGPFETAMVREVLTNSQPRDLTRWLLKVRDALAEQDEAKRDSLLRAADGFLRANNQSLELRGTGLGESRRRESPAGGRIACERINWAEETASEEIGCSINAPWLKTVSGAFSFGLIPSMPVVSPSYPPLPGRCHVA